MAPEFAPLRLQGGCALWRVNLDATAPQHFRVLSEAEQERAQRFILDIDRRRYINGRVALRLLLGQALGMDAAQLQLQPGPQGKPYLRDAPHCRFNASHSGGVGLIGIATDTAPGSSIGLDVEIRRIAPDFDSTAQIILTTSEHQQIMALPADQRDPALLFTWTRKEACLKAIGAGLYIEPSSFATGFKGDCEIRVTDQGTTYVLQLQTLDAGTDVAASLALLTETQRTTAPSSLA